MSRGTLAPLTDPRLQTPRDSETRDFDSIFLSTCNNNKTVVHSNADYKQMCVFSYTLVCCSCDLDLDPMTLTCKSDLDILKMYLYTKNQVPGSKLSSGRARTDR